MEIIPATAVTTLTAQLTSLVGANITGILAVVFFSASVGFVMRLFRRGAKLKG